MFFLVDFILFFVALFLISASGQYFMNKKVDWHRAIMVGLLGGGGLALISSILC